jgi:hypothetical protein
VFAVRILLLHVTASDKIHPQLHMMLMRRMHLPPILAPTICLNMSGRKTRTFLERLSPDKLQFLQGDELSIRIDFNYESTCVISVRLFDAYMDCLASHRIR